MTIIPRSDLNLRPPKYRGRMHTFFNGWFWHWLGNGFPEQMSDKQILQSIQRYHMGTQEWSDVAYNYAVGREVDSAGRSYAYELRGDMVSGGHTKGFNNTSMAVVFLIGEGETPTPAMFVAARQLMADVRPSDLLRSHRDVGNTQCPGDDIANEVLSLPKADTRMTPTQAQLHVDQAYDGLLGRIADASGGEFWTTALINGDWTIADMRFHFLVVRLAADKAAGEAVRADTKGLDPEVVAAQTYRLFLDNLVALAE